MMTDFARSGFDPGMLGLHFQSFFAVFTLVGFVLLTYWAMHNLSKNHLRNVAITILGVGLVGLLTAAWLADLSPRERGNKAECPMQRLWNGTQLPTVTPPAGTSVPSVIR
ncbi:MAG: hypothetical protein V1876_03625 [Candidatus Peregrinibacteria bacterium]